MAIRIAKWLFVAAVVLGVVYGMWAVFCHNVHASLGYVVEARLAYNAFLVGKSLLGMRVTDVQIALRKQTAHAKPSRIVLCRPP